MSLSCCHRCSKSGLVPGASLGCLSRDGAAQGVLDGGRRSLNQGLRCGQAGAPCFPWARTRASVLPPPTVSLFPPADVVNLDLKSTLRVLYNLFTKYKDLE